MESVEDWFIWRSEPGESLEKKYRKCITSLGWEYTDVMYSFLGIYTIGLFVYYPDDFENTLFTIRPKDNTSKTAYRLEFLQKRYRNYPQLNNNKKLKEFIKKYDSIGNIMPIWPGGNVHKGQSYCFDIPEIILTDIKSGVRCS